MKTVFAVVLAFFALTAAAQARPIFWGAHLNGSVYGLPQDDPRAYGRFEADVGKRASLFGLTRWWFDPQTGKSEPFPRAELETIRRRGSIPMLTWAPRGSIGVKPSSAIDPAFRSAVVAGGRYDNYIRSFAAAAKAWNHPFFLRFAWEADGNWYPWGEGRLPNGTLANGNHPGDYVRMWRHVHGIFDSVGVRNVTWVWATNHETVSGFYPSLRQMYPGNAFVDWVGMDPYNRYPGSWFSFTQTIMGAGWIADTFHRITAVSGTKPMMMAEFGSFEDKSNPNRKAAWIRSALQSEIPNRTLIKAILYYNGGSRTEGIYAETSPQSLAAFRAGIANPAYQTNHFANLPPTKIGAP